MTPVQPVIIQGPAVIEFDSAVFYTTGPITLSHARPMISIANDYHGVVGKRFGTEINLYELSFPVFGFLPSVANIADLAKYFPYGPWTYGATLVAESRGVQYAGTANDKSVVVHTKAGVTHTFEGAMQTGSPSIHLGPDAQIFGGNMSFQCIGKYNTARTDAAYQRTIASQALSVDTKYAPHRAFTGIYSAAWNSITGIGAMMGFDFSVSYDVGRVAAGDFGIAALSLNGIQWSGSFAPSAMTPAQVDTLLKNQNTGAIQPGDAANLSDLVVTGDYFVFTLKTASPTGYTGQYGSNVHQHGVITFENEATWTSGVSGPLVVMNILA